MRFFSVVVSEDQSKSKESNSFAVEQLSCCSEVVGIESMVAVDVEVGTIVNNYVSCSEVMENTKQTKWKQNSGHQGMPATFPNKGKPGGKRLGTLLPEMMNHQMTKVMKVTRKANQTTTITL